MTRQPENVPALPRAVTDDCEHEWDFHVKKRVDEVEYKKICKKCMYTESLGSIPNCAIKWIFPYN